MSYISVLVWPPRFHYITSQPVYIECSCWGRGITSTFTKHSDHYWIPLSCNPSLTRALQKSPVLGVWVRNFHLFILQSSSLCNFHNHLLSVIHPSYIIQIFTYFVFKHLYVMCISSLQFTELSKIYPVLQTATEANYT